MRARLPVQENHVGQSHQEDVMSERLTGLVIAAFSGAIVGAALVLVLA